MRWFLTPFICVVALSLTGWGHHEPRVKIGLSLDDSRGREVFLQEVKESMEDNEADLLIMDAKGNPAVQETQARDLIQQGVQALVIIPCDPSKAVPLVETAHHAGIKVLALGSPIPNCGLDYLIALNREKAGELQAQSLLKLAPKGRYVLLGEGSSSGFEKELRQGQMKVLQPSIDKGDIQITSSLNPSSTLTPRDRDTLADPNINAILASNSALAGEAVEVRKAAGFAAVAGMGDDRDTWGRIQSGKQSITVFLSPKKLAEETAYLSAKLARKAKQFECQFTEMPNGETTVKAVLLTPIVVDNKNVDLIKPQD